MKQNFKTSFCNSKKDRKELNKKTIIGLSHEGVKCTRKFGNTKHTVIGTEKRTTLFDKIALRNSEIPGPGTHTPSLSPQKSRPSSALLDTRGVRIKAWAAPDFTPGPGQYTQRDSFKLSENQQWKSIKKGTFSKTIRTPLFKQQSATGIGPQYALKSSLSSRSPSFGKKLISEIEQRSPGPCHYSIQASILSRNGVKIGTAPRNTTFLSQNKVNPGPGTYSPTLIENTSSYRSIGQKLHKNENNQNPGPGSYDPKTVHQNPSSTAFAVASRSELFTSNSKQQFPGPGTYQQILRWAIKSKMTIGKKYKNNNQNKNPGPDHYDTNSHAILYKSPSAVFGTEKKKVLFSSRDSSRTPGPGDHYPDSTKISRSPIVYSIPQSRNSPRKADIQPGPGHYSFTVDFNDTRGSSPSQSSFKVKGGTVSRNPRKTEESFILEGSGPNATFLTQDKFRTDRGHVIFDKSSRFATPKTIEPGPGTYDA